MLWRGLIWKQDSLPHVRTELKEYKSSVVYTPSIAQHQIHCTY